MLGGVCKDVRRKERKRRVAEWLAGLLGCTGGTNKNQKVPHLDEGVCLLIIIVR